MNFDRLSLGLKKELDTCSVNTVIVCSEATNAIDLTIMNAMYSFAYENSLPSCLVLIFGDVDYAWTHPNLHWWGYTIGLVIHNNAQVSLSLKKAANFVFKMVSVGLWRIMPCYRLMTTKKKASVFSSVCFKGKLFL